MVTVGFNVATEHWYSNKVTLFLKTLLLLALLHIPFSRHETSVWRNRVDTLLPSYAQEWATKTAEYVNENYPNRFYYYCNPQLAVVLKEKEYIVTKWKIFEDLRNKQAQPRKDAIVIWDSQFTPIDNSVTQEAMDTDPRFEFVKEFPEKGRYIWFRIYKVK